MRRISLFLLVFVLIVNFMGCSNSSSISTDNKVEGVVEDVKKDEIKDIKLGESIDTDSFTLILNKVELTYDVLPDDTSGFYTHYPADSGKVYISIDVDVKNTQKQNLNCDEIIEVYADYNDGYIYNASPIVKDSSTGFTYANISRIDPLETKGMKYLIDCPEEIETSQNPLFLIFKIGNGEYKYVIR